MGVQTWVPDSRGTGSCFMEIGKSEGEVMTLFLDSFLYQSST